VTGSGSAFHRRLALTAAGVCWTSAAGEAYAIGGVPIPWIGGLLVIVSAVLLGRRAVLLSGVRFPLMLLLGYWAVAVASTAGNMILRRSELQMPGDATTDLGVFVTLRVVAIAQFVGAVVVGSAYVRQRTADARAITRDAAAVLYLVASYGVYVYFAQLAGWPEIPRTRIGTDGVAQITEFQSLLHRAMGSFREPSHLAEWLLVPLVLLLVASRRLAPALLGGTTLVLTLSLAGLVATGVAVVVSLLGMLSFRRPGSLRQVMHVAAALSICGLAAGGVAQSYIGVRGSVVQNVIERARPVIEARGLRASNRGEIIDAAQALPLTLVGRGLGIANLDLTQRLGWPIPASFLSVYRFALHSVGVVGLALLVLALTLAPAPAVFTAASRGPVGAAAVGCWIAWLLLAAVRAEELSVLSGFCLGMVGGVAAPTERDDA